MGIENLDLSNIEASLIESKLHLLKKDVENTMEFRTGFSQRLGISLEKEKNGKLGNFTLGVIDGLLEFPLIIELYINSFEFREKLLMTITQISIKDFVNSILDIGEEVAYGDAYLKGKSGVKLLLLATGLVGLLRQFGYVVLKQGSKISLQKSTIALTATTLHSVGYASHAYTKDKFGVK